MKNEFNRSVQASAWAKRNAQKESRKEFWLKVGDALDVFAIALLLFAGFFLLYGFGY